MPEVGLKAFLGNTEIFVNNAYLGATQIAINPYNLPGKLVPSDGLVFYVDASVPQSYPGSGTVWKDLSGNDKNFTTYNSSTFPTYSATSSSFVFNGTTNVLSARNTGSLNSITSNTQLAWVKLATLTPTGSSVGEGVVNNGENAQENGFDALEFNEVVASRWSDIRAGGGNFVTASSNETSLDWLLIGVTRTTNSYKLWRNGVEIGSSTAYSPQTYTDGRFAIGNRHSNGAGWISNGYFGGEISMVLMYNRALSAQEIDYIYKLGR